LIEMGDFKNVDRSFLGFPSSIKSNEHK
jgi:hypothetical protein